MFARFDDTRPRGKEVALGRVWFGFGESPLPPAPDVGDGVDPPEA